MHTRYYPPQVEIKDYNVMVDGRKPFSSADKKLFENIWKHSKNCNWPWNESTSGSLLDYNHFKKYCIIITIDLSKQQALDADPKAMRQISFIGNLDRTEGAIMFFIIEETKKTILDVSQVTMRVL